MAHNLSMDKEGNAEFAFAGEKPWHGLGVEVPGLMTTGEALTAARMDWGIKKVPVLSSYDMSVIPDQYAILRDDTHVALGIVGARYEPINNREVFSIFDGVLGETHAQIETAGALGKGERVFMQARLPEITEVVPGDVMEQMLLIHASHDGSGAEEVLFVNQRVVCQNTLSMALNSQKNRFKIRHTKNYKDKMAQVERILMESKNYWEKIREATKHLAETSVSRVEVGAFMDAMFPVKEDAKRDTTSNTRNKFEELLETGMGTEIPGVKGSAWGVFNAYSEYLQYGRTVNKIDDPYDQNGKRWEKIVFGSFGDDMQKAFDHLLVNA